MKMSSQKYWVLANAIGLAIYLFVSSGGWAPHGKEGQNGGPAVLVGLFSFPVLATFMAVNLTWCVKGIFHLRSRERRPLLICLGVILLWSGAVYYDWTRQFKGTDAVQLNEWK